MSLTGCRFLSCRRRKPMIKIANTKDFGFVCLCAVRYCLGRRTIDKVFAHSPVLCTIVRKV